MEKGLKPVYRPFFDRKQKLGLFLVVYFERVRSWQGMHCAHQFDASIDFVFSLVLTECYHNVLTITFVFTQPPEAPHVSGLYFERIFSAFDSVDESTKLVHLDVVDLG